MTDERTAPLRPRDPRHLGPYELLGRLGEGGMGTVFLARGLDGERVAVKMVRVDLDHDDEFRRRFRSEVNRVKQVPPFCTAEVLDADPDHEFPYLVVEFVDGPSLAEVVEERGPLKSSNLHSVAIGVATALTAIHGAGVIHRDLKPRNVLLAPGSPKVIDFGIARALEATSAHTQTDQLVGTVAYMAPERFGSAAGVLLTPAADVFAWGAVVAYAGMGRTPFSADSATATAGRILTQPPDLSGLSGSLRDLVAHTLEKEPANRPTARELLDLLVDGGPERPAATAAALVNQPGLRAAAREAQAVTGYHQLPANGGPATGSAANGGPATGSAANGGPGDGSAANGGPANGGQAGGGQAIGREAGGSDTSGSELAASLGGLTTLAIEPGLIGYHEESIVTQPVTGEMTVLAKPRRRRRRWLLPLAVALLIATVVAGVAMVGRSWPGAGAAIEAPPPTQAPLPDDQLLVADPLHGVRLWQPSVLPAEQASCSFADALVVRRETRGSYRCQGPQDTEPVDVEMQVDVRLITQDSCAAIWFRFHDAIGYQVRICQNNIYVGTHKNSNVVVYKTFPLDEDPIMLGALPTTISLKVSGSTVEIGRDGEPVGTVDLVDAEITGGSVVLGIYTERNAPEAGPYEVAFTDIKVWSL